MQGKTPRLWNAVTIILYCDYKCPNKLGALMEVKGKYGSKILSCATFQAR